MPELQFSTLIPRILKPKLDGGLGQLLLFDYSRIDGRCGEIRSFRRYRLEERLGGVVN